MHSLYHVAESDGFETLLLVGTLEQCLELQAHPSMAGFEPGRFEVRS